MKNPFKTIKKGALKKQLGVPADQTLPKGIVEKMAGAKIGSHVEFHGKSVKVTPLMKKRALFAKNFGYKHDKDDD